MSHASPVRTIIVAGVDAASDSARWVVDRAFDETLRRAPTDLHLLYTTDGDPHSAADQLFAVCCAELDLFVDAAKDTDWTLHSHVRTGDPAEELALLAEEVGADLICIGARTRSRDDVPERLLSVAGCPVLVSRPKEYSTPRGELRRTPCPERIAGESGEPFHSKG
jgi:nucleotide-binding universal stress UspA family protein